MGIARPDVTAKNFASDIFDEIFKVMAESTERTVCANMRTVLALIEIVMDYQDVLGNSDFESVTDALASGDLIERLKDVLSENPRMYRVSEVADDLIMQVVAEEISDFSKFSEDMREQLFEQIADVLTSTSDISSSARNEIVFQEVSSALEEYGVYTNDDIAEKITEILVDGIGGAGGQVTTSDVREYFESFTGAGD